MRPAARSSASVLAVLAALGLAGCVAPTPDSVGSSSLRAWREGFGRALAGYRDGTRAGERTVRREQIALRRAGDAEGARRSYLNALRTHQRLAMTTIRTIDELGDPPRDGESMVGMMRRLLKHRLNVSRQSAEAVMAFDFDRADRIADHAERDEIPLRRAILRELDRLAPGATKANGKAAAKAGEASAW